MTCRPCYGSWDSCLIPLDLCFLIFKVLQNTFCLLSVGKWRYFGQTGVYMLHMSGQSWNNGQQLKGKSCPIAFYSSCGVDGGISSMVPSNNIKNQQQPKNSCKQAEIRQFFQFTCVQLCLWKVNILSRGAWLCFIHCTKQTVPLEAIILNPIIIILQVLYQTEFSFLFH